MALTPAERVGASAAGALALLYVARSYWRVPLAIWRRPISVQRAQLRYERAGDGPTPPAAATAWLADRAAALAALGFRGTPPFRETADTGVSMYHQLHEHAETGDVAAVGVFMRDAEEEVANTTISFRSVLADGSEVKTLHDARGLPVVTPDPPGSTVLRIGGGVQVSDDPSDLGRLYRLHRALVRRRGVGPQRRID
ncbi:MAG TPA: hypothetical protein VKA84_07295, partial [Gemmatimonadaceae bacterium]|nr:hypothetical protein [Gemmatimonadaceae bacterium]